MFRRCGALSKDQTIRFRWLGSPDQYVDPGFLNTYPDSDIFIVQRGRYVSLLRTLIL